MGQKVSPHGLRVGVIKDWNSKWYADKGNFADMLVEDNKIREYVKKKLYVAGVSKVLIERSAENKIKVTVLTARPGMVIGHAGNGVDELKKALVKLTKKDIDISIEEIRRSELDAQLTAESVAQALERRVSFRRAMKQAISRTMKANAKGIKILCSGRLGGAEIARSEKYSEGNVPLHTIRADIDYGFAEADTTYGKIGVKVWINHGEILDKGLQSPVREEKRDRRERRGKGDRRRNDRRRDDRRRDDRQPAAKVALPRTRKAPKAKPEAEAPQVEAPAAETAAVTEE
ncbi:MAG TPA: 30S ribosomal protein S3 [Candidatus Avanaerovorax faecigallinarum]|nr:30S ribosomal protein S3 [Candidatus Avanaerovorax faecigallinarum]